VDRLQVLASDVSLGSAGALIGLGAYASAILAIIEQINAAGTTILLVGQSARMALAAADRGNGMEGGRVALAGTAGRFGRPPR
jgi:branched-chain amino acid transport system ATP-binding protein